jgi:hypothetical protein
MVILTVFHRRTFSENFTLTVHRPPMFSVQMKKIYTLKIGSVFELIASGTISIENRTELVDINDFKFTYGILNKTALTADLN